MKKEPFDKQESLFQTLRRSHLLVAFLGVGLLAVTFGSIFWLRTNALRLAEIRGPAAQATERIFAGQQRSVANLRGWITLENEDLKSGRHLTWQNEIWPALDQLKNLSNEFSASDQQRLIAVKSLLEDLEEWQWWIEDVAHTPGNYPAHHLIVQDIDPVVAEIDKHLLHLTDKMKTLASKMPSASWPLVDFRNAFHGSLASLQNFADEGGKNDEESFEKWISQASEHLKQLKNKGSPFVKAKDHEWLNAEFLVYASYARNIIKVRKTPAWNQAQYWFAEKALPLERQTTQILEQLAQNQNELMLKEGKHLSWVSNSVLLFVIATILFMIVSAFVISKRAARRITQPIINLTKATEEMAAGRESADLPVLSQDEIGQLTNYFNTMRTTLAEKEQKFQVAVESSPNGLLMVDDQGKIILLNAQIEELFGYSKDELLGEPIEILLPEPIHKRHVEHRNAFFQDPTRRAMGATRDLYGKRKDGSEFPVEVGLNPIKTKNGFFALAAVVDITQRKMAEKTLVESKMAADQANKTKSEFLANMSHELRTPLNSIIGFSNILLKNKRSNLEESDINYLNRIFKNGNHLLGLINEVLDLSKVEAGKTELEIKAVDLNELIKDVLHQFESQVKDKQIQLIEKLPNTIDSLQADPFKLKQILMNLIANAIKFTQKGHVTIQLKTQPKTSTPMRLEIIDSGIGIPTDQIANVFKPFTQGDGSTKRKYGGTGLGLTISRSLLKLMGFNIEVTSEEGHGSTFSILFNQSIGKNTDLLDPLPKKTIPGQEAETTEKISPIPPIPIGNGNNLVLVIDDESDSRILMIQTLEELGCEVISANSGPQGLKMAREFKPNLITLDLMMPNMSGFEVLKKIQEDQTIQDIPVIVVSIVADENKNNLMGVLDTLNKPFSAQQMQGVLKKVFPNQKGRVLIVEDDESSREVISYYLQEEEFQCDLAENGEEALEFLARHKPDLIVLDLMMPVMDGCSFLKAIQQKPEWKSIPIVVVTAKNLTSNEISELGKKVHQIIPKGNNLEEEIKMAVKGIFKFGTAQSSEEIQVH